MSRLALLLPAMLASALPTAAAQSAPTLTPTAALTRLAQAPSIDAAWFTADFNAALPSIRGGFKSFSQQYGTLQGVDELGAGQYRLRYTGGAVTLEAALNASGQFTKLFLKGSAANVPAPTPLPTSPAASATVSTPQAALERLLSAPTPQDAWFSQEFLAQVSAPQLSTILSNLRRDLGAFHGIKAGADGSFTAQFEAGTLPIKGATVDTQGRFTGLLFGTPQLTQKPTLQSVLADFKALSGTTSVAVIENGKLLNGLNAQTKLGVGSAFKLGVLSELQAQVMSGKHRWDEVVYLQAANKSLPSGFLHTWPDGSPLTVQSLATLMISQSDNTATDTLLNLVGRAGVARRLGLDSVPSTREFFALKNPANSALKTAYLAAVQRSDAAQQQSALSKAATAPLPGVSLFVSGAPVSPEVEWWVSATTLCGLMNEVAALPLTQVNPGLADTSNFKRVSFKGGSESGVLNYTTQVSTQDGRSVCLSATTNDSKAIDTTAFSSVYSRLLQAVK